MTSPEFRNLFDALAARGILQDDLAKLLGTSQANVSRWYNDRNVRGAISQRYSAKLRLLQAQLDRDELEKLTARLEDMRRVMKMIDGMLEHGDGGAIDYALRRALQALHDAAGMAEEDMKFLTIAKGFLQTTAQPTLAAKLAEGETP